MKRHLALGKGFAIKAACGRSNYSKKDGVCNLWFKPLEGFLKEPEELRCAKCNAIAASIVAKKQV